MDQLLSLHIVLEKPPPGIDFGLQKGSGKVYDTIQLQRSSTADLFFQFEVRVKNSKTSTPDFFGPFVQGPPDSRFVYIDIGSAAGQKETYWNRRLKIPLRGISWEMIDQINSDSNLIIEAKVPGTGKDFGPTCGTVKPFNGWHLKKL